MKRFAIAMALFASLGVSACSSSTPGDWTPWGAGRTAGTGDVTVSKAAPKADMRGSADASFNGALRK